MAEVTVTKEEWDRVIEMLDQANKTIESAQKWISVKERLPEDRHSVLVYCPYNKCIYTAYYDDFNDEWYYFGCGGGIEVYYTVTNWMPLPEPPKEGETEDDGNA
jgi:hypothetical protein